MEAFELVLGGQAASFYGELTGSDLVDVRGLLYDDIEKHPRVDDPEPPHLVKKAAPHGRFTTGVLCTDGKWWFYYHFPEPGIVEVRRIGRRPPPFPNFAEYP